MYPITPTTPQSAGILVSAAGNAAHDRRNNNNKTIMNCLRDRTPSHNRPVINAVNVGGLRPDAATVVLLREPPRRNANKLALLKATSTRDLSRFIVDTSDVEISTSNSSTSSSNARNYKNNYSQRGNTCDSKCLRRITDLESRVIGLEQDLQEQRKYNEDMEAKLTALTQKVEELTVAKVEKRKKVPSDRKKDANGNILQPSKLIAWMNLSNLWKHRPSIQTLKEQNIYNDEPCFDTEIELVVKSEVHKTVPKIVVDCCDLIEEKYRQSSHPIEGIYRQCGDYNKIQSLRFSIDNNDYDALRQQNIDIHTLTGVLKLFLREIKTPLVSINEAKTFIGKPNQWVLTELPTKIETLKRLIRSLPEVNRDTMEYLFAHFHKLTKVPLQHVSAETLSLSVTPSIFHTVQQGVHMQDIHVLMKESEILADCVKIMIEYHSRIFEPEEPLYATVDLDAKWRI